MGLGPFITYVPPGVYTRTLTDANAANLVAGIRIPAIIGVGQQELTQSNTEIVRGSSSTYDEQIVNEDPTLAWVVDATNPNNLILGAQTGLLTTFKVRNTPIVDGQGFGRVTNDVRAVSVTVDGTPVAVGSVNGQKGLITLQVPTDPTKVVRVTYYFHRGDTSFTDDVSSQVTGEAATITTPGFEPFVITSGVNDVFTFKSNGTQYQATLIQGNLTAATVQAQLASLGIPNFSAAVYTDGQGKKRVQMVASQSLEILDGTANGPLGFTNFTKTARNATFTVFNRPIVDGSGSGTTTTDPTKVVVKVNGSQVVASSVDGANGTVTLPYAPAMGSTVVVTYWANTWQDTYDYLPNTMVTTVSRCGIAPNRADYIQGQDFVILNPSSDVSVIHWGASWSISPAATTVGAEPFDGSQVTGQLVDAKLYLAECTRVVNTTVIPAVVSTTQFLLPEVPTTGNGRDTTLGTAAFNTVTNGRYDLITNRPDLVVVRVGRNLRDALNRPAVTVTKVDGASRLITLQSPVPPDWKAYATFYYNTLQDDTFLLTCTVPGPVGVGQYQVASTTLGSNLRQTRFGNKVGLAQIVQWPRGVEQIPDAFHTGSGTPVDEVVTVTFGQADAKNAVYTIKGVSPYSFYSPFSATWATNLNGVAFSTNLGAPAPATLVGAHVTPIQTGLDTGKITITAGVNDELTVVVDGASTTVTLAAGNRTRIQITSDINVALGGSVASSYQIGGINGDIVFVLTSPTTPGALPGGFDSVSTVSISQGTAETTLGFASFASASGTTGAINKPATLLGTIAGPFAITAGLNDTFKFRHAGLDYQVTLPAGPAVGTAAVVAAINAVLASISSNGTLANLDKVRLTSTTNDPTSSLVILDGNANATLGFTQNDSASQVLVTAEEVAAGLMATLGFTAEGLAYPSTLGGQTYLTVESLTTGLLTSSVGFTASANSAFNLSTGVNITPGTDGDVGEDAQQIFTVSSNVPNGSAGTGIPGQTYTDAITGLRFTVLPAQTGSYTNGGNFTLLVSTTFRADPARPFYAVGGLELTVSNTVGVPTNDTASLQTFNPGGVEPRVGDLYYVTYNYLKQGFDTRVFRQLKTIEANFGPVSAENRVSLGAYLAILNGALLVAVKQVLKVPNTNQGSDNDFIQAIDDLSTPLPGNIRPDILVPLSTGNSVYAFLTQHCEVQSDIRNQNECMGYIGFASGTIPSAAQTVARNLNSSRIAAFYPDSAVITLTDELGRNSEQLVDGTFFGAAFSGAVASPAVDVATPWDRRRIQGITRLIRVMDPVEANQTATAGITVLEDLDTLIRVRHGLTTKMDSVLTRTPTVVQIADFVQQQSRGLLDAFVGTKFLASRTNEVNVSMTGLFRQLIQAEIIAAFTGVTSAIDPDDPTVLRFEAYYQPIFPLLYLVLTFNLRARILAQNQTKSRP